MELRKDPPATRPRVPPATPVAAELTTGRLLDAPGALRMGIVGAVHPAAELMPRTVELASGIASGPSQAIAETKRRILLDREQAIDHLFEEEERLLRERSSRGPDDAA